MHEYSPFSLVWSFICFIKLNSFCLVHYTVYQTLCIKHSFISDKLFRRHLGQKILIKYFVAHLVILSQTISVACNWVTRLAGFLQINTDYYLPTSKFICVTGNIQAMLTSTITINCNYYREIHRLSCKKL